MLASEENAISQASLLCPVLPTCAMCDRLGYHGVTDTEHTTLGLPLASGGGAGGVGERSWLPLLHLWQCIVVDPTAG